MPGTPAPPADVPAADPLAPPVSQDCANSWGVFGTLAQVLSVPTRLLGIDICRPGAVRPIPDAHATCTVRVDGARLHEAAQKARPGDRICLRGDSDKRLKLTRSGVEGNPVQVIGDGESNVKGVSVRADHVVVRGLNITGASAPGIELFGNNITLLNNMVTAPRGGDGDGIRFFGRDIQILHNTVRDVRNAGGAHADCMQTFATNTPASKDVLIHSNRCEKIDNQCLIAEGPNSSAGDGSGQGESSNITFANNFCESHAAQAVMIDDVKNVVITANEITGRNKKAFAFDNESTGARVSGNKIAQTIGYEVGMDRSSREGYQGPEIGGAP